MDYLLNTKKEYKKVYAQGTQDIYQNELDKACFKRDIAYGDFKDLPRRTVSIKYYVIKHLMLQKIQIMINMKEALLQCFANFWIKNLLLTQG